ncbi:MAG: prephenate dehydrogenase/arogenate dehydrogenase family protein, partial [Candidatus Nanopelagicales bacterium]
AAPTNAALEILKELAASEFSGLVSDIGSTKSLIHKSVNNKINFVGTHPMAGSHLAGWDSADPTIFHQAPWALTLDQAKEETTLAKLIEVILFTGAWVVPTFAKQHDEAVVVSSHLAHLISAGFGLTIENAENQKLIEALVGGSYRDLSRITLSPSERTAEIVWPNRDDLVIAIDTFIANLQGLKKTLKADEVDNLVKLLTRSGQSRARVEVTQQLIQKQQTQILSIKKGELIGELRELALDPALITSFQIQNDDYQITLAR